MSDAVLVPTNSKVKVRFVCPEEYKTEFASSRCMLAISVGQPKHEDNKLLTTLRRVNREFNECTIMMADTLQRFNLKFSYPSLSWSELHDLSMRAGDEWLRRNADAINQLTIPHEIIRWDKWLNDPNYKTCRELIDILYNENESFGMAVFQTVQELALRLDKNNIRLNCLSLFKYSMEYVKEECAAQLLMAKSGYEFILYPGRLNPGMKYIYDLLITSNPLNKLKWVDIKIERPH